MLSRKLNIMSLVICFTFTQTAFAKSGLTINGGEGAVNPMASLSIAGATHRTSNNTYTIQFRASCFGTNLRGVANPISPNATITMTGNIQLDSGSFQPFSISFPAAAALVDNRSNAGISGSNLPPNSSVAFSGNMLVAKIKSSASTSINPVTAEITTAQERFEVRDIAFTQELLAVRRNLASSIVVDRGAQRFNDGGMMMDDMGIIFGQAAIQDEPTFREAANLDREIVNPYADMDYYGKNGPLSSSAINISKSSDGKVIDIETSFPGEEGYCGGYHSPLMVFLDEKIPKFNNIVDFKMGHGLKTFWPEKNHDGYFVALPNKNGQVMSNDELFGESKEFHNGFEKLATHDLNKDGVIDAKDPVFKKLVLWKDSSGKGVYYKKHGMPLSQMIKSINLKFQPNIMQVSASAELREKSTVVLHNPKKHPKAYIVDVWFKPALGTEQNLNLPKLSSK